MLDFTLARDVGARTRRASDVVLARLRAGGDDVHARGARHAGGPALTGSLYF